MPTGKEQLLEMGFTEDLVEKALKNTENHGIEAAMDWIIAHQVDDTSNKLDGEDEKEMNEQAPTNCAEEARSYLCEDCQKVLSNDEAVQLHSSLTGHVNYSESTEELKPPTEEEKQAQMKRLQGLLEQKKLQRIEQEKQKELEMEKRRRSQGKTLVSAQAKYREEEMRRFVEENRREKQMDKEYREKLKAEIAKDHEARKARARGEDPEQVTVQPTAVVKPAASSIAIVAPQSSSCRLKVRLPDGQPLRHDFEPSDKLSTVLTYISNHWPGLVDTDRVQVFMNYPRRYFSSSDNDKTLEELGLCPSAALIAKRMPS